MKIYLRKVLILAYIYMKFMVAIDGAVEILFVYLFLFEGGDVSTRRPCMGL